MCYNLRPNIINLNKSSYAVELDIQDLSKTIDCSTGTNPFGFSKEISKEISSINYFEMIHSYPESNNILKDSIITFWKKFVQLDQENIVLGDGSIDILYKINRLFLNSESKVLGYSPQFSDYIDDVNSYGCLYDYSLLLPENNYKFVFETLLKKIRSDYSLIYIDNPNNPTGQIISLSDIEEIVKHAQKNGVCTIIDEAYGDFMNKENSAITLIGKYDNLFVSRTFSKGLGLAGLRAGYLITSKELATHYKKVSNPYSMNAFARYLAIIAIKDTNFINESRRKINQLKSKIIDSMKNFTVLHTDNSLPIMTIKHPNPQIDLQKALLKHNILTVSGRCFMGLDKSSVRLRIPTETGYLMDVLPKIIS
ncbi:MAG: histidinol-phosphate aminotransferase family protein [Clostridia bacterium]|nr:histidinol-phosphate aminotransferase family protein [Clostridia bacterium]